MTLNELCTNTTKFGALLVPAGSVDIAWKIDEGMERLQLTWCEKGGPSVRAPSGPHDRRRSLYYGWPLVVGIPCRQDFRAVRRDLLLAAVPRNLLLDTVLSPVAGIISLGLASGTKLTELGRASP
jgi:hypothetical protein